MTFEFFSMFWVDQIVREVLTKNPNDNYVITDWKTPSGRIHVGSLRGVLIHGCVARGLAEQGKKALWQYGFDDADPMDSLPVYVPDAWKEHLGKPLASVPSPQAGFVSYGAYYAHEFEQVFKQLGEQPKIVYTSKLYQGGIFNDAIKIVLDQADKIRNIYVRVTQKKQPDDWLPIQMICQKCGKVGTTRAYAWDGQRVSYRCEKNWVKYVGGCDFDGNQDPFDGNAKLPWRVEWPTKWYIFKTDIEGAGKDHQTKGGSHDMAVAIYDEVFHKKIPYNVPYEFFLVEGQKMSSSKGIGSTAQEVSNTTPPELLRMLMIRTRPNRAINFTPAGDSIPHLYDEYDKAAEAYVNDPTGDLGRLLSYSRIESTPINKFHYRFSKIAYMTQIPHIDLYKKVEEEKGARLTDEERIELETRIDYAKKWLASYAPEEFKLTVQQSLPDALQQLNDQQKNFLHQLAAVIDSRSHWDGFELHAKIHKLKLSMKLKPIEAFSAIYWAILGQPSGPQAGWFLAALDREFVVKRFREV